MRVVQLLGRHVAGGAAEAALDAQAGALARAGHPAVEVLREAEVGDERPAVGREEHVLRLHVAVDDAAGVRLAQGAPEQAAELGGAFDLEGTLLEEGSKRPAREEGHDEVGLTVGLPGAEERNEPLRLAEPRLEALLAREAGASLGVAALDELDRDRAAVLAATPEDDAEAAAADLVEDLVRACAHRSRLAARTLAVQRQRGPRGGARRPSRISTRGGGGGAPSAREAGSPPGRRSRSPGAASRRR